MFSIVFPKGLTSVGPFLPRSSSTRRISPTDPEIDQAGQLEMRPRERRAVPIGNSHLLQLRSERHFELSLCRARSHVCNRTPAGGSENSGDASPFSI
jgi:hypothetical protein